MTHTFIRTLSLAIAFAAILMVPVLAPYTDTLGTNHDHVSVVSEL